MALQNTVGADTVATALTPWLAERVGADDVRIEDVTVNKASGMSSESVMFTGRWSTGGQEVEEHYVVRVAPRGEGVFMNYDLVREAEIMTAVAATTSVPAPEVVLVGSDKALFGAEFVVMSRSFGQVPSDDPPFTGAGWVLDLKPSDRGLLIDNALETLVELHRPNLEDLGLTHLLVPELGATAVEQDIARWKDYYAWAARGVSNRTIDEGLQWIESNLPAPRGDIGLAWGDARPGNMMFAEDLSLSGVFDWEMASPGVPDADVAWFSFMHRHHTEGMGLANPDGMPAPEAVADRYVELGGRDLPDLHFYLGWTAVRCSMIFTRVGHYMTELGLVPAEQQMWSNNVSTQLLHRILDVAEPVGPSNGWIDGKR